MLTTTPMRLKICDTLAGEKSTTEVESSRTKNCVPISDEAETPSDVRTKWFSACVQLEPGNQSFSKQHQSQMLRGTGT